MAKKNICTLIHGRLLRSIREGGFISTSVHTYSVQAPIETMTHIRLSPEVKIKKEVLCTVIHGSQTQWKHFISGHRKHFVPTDKRNRAGSEGEGRREGRDLLVTPATQKKRGKARSFSHISSIYIASVHGGCEKNSLWPPDGEKKVKTLLFRAALDVFSLALQAPPPLPPSNQKSLTRPLGKRRERRVCACVYTAAPGEKEFSKPEAEGGRRVFFSFSSSSSSSS